MRRPDWQDPRFWTWAIKACNASPTQLTKWWSETTRAGWEHRKYWARDSLGIEFPTLTNANNVRHPDKPPTGWPYVERKDTRAPNGKPHTDSLEWMKGGGYCSTKLIEMDLEESKDPDFLLRAHGFDVAEWEITAARNNIWNTYSKQDGVKTLYSSKITVAPRQGGFDLDACIDAVRSIEPVKIAPAKGRADDALLEIPLFDMHWGVSDIEQFGCTRDDICALIGAGKRKGIVFGIGSDLFHNDNFRNATANGTAIAEMDYPKAWAGAASFYFTLIELALEWSETVTIIYVKGNHDESMAWAFCQMLAAKYPQVTFDLAIEERKVHAHGGICIGFTHGDKARKDYDRIFNAEFSEFASARVKEIHTGHKHHERTVDVNGVLIRGLSTRNRSDQWHTDEGWVGAVKRFMLFEYRRGELRHVHYV